MISPMAVCLHFPKVVKTMMKRKRKKISLTTVRQNLEEIGIKEKRMKSKLSKSLSHK